MDTTTICAFLTIVNYCMIPVPNYRQYQLGIIARFVTINIGVYKK